MVLVVLLGLLVCSGFLPVAARADYVTLKSGGEIRGELLAGEKTAPATAHIQLRSLSGAFVVVQKDQVEAVVRRRPVVEEYETRRRAAPDTLAGNWELSEWCRQKSLTRERASHLQRVLEFDGDHVLAHRALGHIRDQGRWTTRDELLIARGYVRHKGKLILPQELQLNDQQERMRDAERNWVKRVKQWQGWLESERSERKSTAVARLNAIRDPDAIPALSRSFRDAPDEDHRLLFVRILSVIEGDKSLAALVAQSVVDESRAVRDASLTAVRRKDPAKAIPMYVRALKNALNPIVNRAASALGQLGDERVIPHLIEALLTRHEYRALVHDQNSQIPASETMDLVAIIGPLSEKKAAFGKSPAKDPDSESAVFDADCEEFEVNVAKQEENPEVLAALTLLTSQNFGYDVPAWRDWHNRLKNAGAKKAK
jgi:hypothetical protein